MANDFQGMYFGEQFNLGLVLYVPYFFKAEWHPMSDEMFFVGSMNRPRQIDVYTVSGKHYNLKGEDLGSVCSIVKCHPTQDIVVGGNSSGRVHVFM